MRYVFGNCVLDTERYLLHRAGQPIRLWPKVFRLLIYLLTQRERVIPKQELSEQVWNGNFISDATLESTLAALRRALGDHGRDYHYIQTLHGHGYRFVAPVREAPELLSSAAGETSPVVAETVAPWQRDGPPRTADEPLPTPVYRLLGLHSRPVPIGWRGGGPLSPFVGRGHALVTFRPCCGKRRPGRAGW